MADLRDSHGLLTRTLYSLDNLQPDGTFKADPIYYRSNTYQTNTYSVHTCRVGGLGALIHKDQLTGKETGDLQ